MGHHFSDSVIALDDAGQSLGYVIEISGDLVPNVLAGYGGQGCFLRRLPDASVSADPRECCVPVPYGNREVERTDDANDTEGVPLLVHAVPWALGMHREAVQLAGKANGEIADVNHFLHLSEAFLEALAHLV